ncbi:hypothetical protein K402DRAFT_450218 [Aulographum hederae CBS 113979]|uniref:Telomere length regulation protein conserved domain-containing protein n=1 Tax=Aulographum hederae CBS 113979 TaxID=1176131 RepID=A0A6G1HFT6_9PEZI|nr:hypothetical protein K402DRAFT_450218 [Aulographum hederae CBS 113979]
MDDLLTPVHTTSLRRIKVVDNPTPSQSGSSQFTSAQDVLGTLRNQPGLLTLKEALQYLLAPSKKTGFDIKTPGPLAAQILNVIASDIIPSYWATFEEHGEQLQERRLLLECLLSVAGIGALHARVKVMSPPSGSQQSRVDPALKCLLSVLSSLLKNDHFSEDIWQTIQLHSQNDTQRMLLWREYMAIVASGRLLSTAMNALDCLKKSNEEADETWFTQGKTYAQWLGRNISSLIKASKASDTGKMKAVAQLLGKSLTIGYNDHLVDPILSLVVSAPSESVPVIHRLLISCSPHEARRFFLTAISIIESKFLVGSSLLGSLAQLSTTTKQMQGSAALLRSLIEGNAALTEFLTSMLTGDAGASRVPSIAFRRIALAVLADEEDRVQAVLDRSIQQFGDQMFIKNMPMLEQEAAAQVLLLASGYVHRTLPMYLFTLARSSDHNQGISNRIAATSPRARWLGMVVGMAISELVDKPDKRMVFESSEMQTDEAKWHRQLIYVNDTVGSFKDLQPSEPKPDQERTILSIRNRNGNIHQQQKPQIKSDGPSAKNTRKAGTNQSIPQGLRIVELKNDEESEGDDDLIPYGKPDYDPEDEEEDPTMIQRNKPVAPVYIRDLLTGLRDSEDYDRHTLALTTASSLIRRKANFGTEVTDHIHELVTVLLNLDDHFELDNFQELRQQALIAAFIAQPKEMGQYLARSFFEGDYSITQRLAILTALGLGARELAGFKKEDGDFTGADKVPDNAFPSKPLPAKFHKIYSPNQNDAKKSPVEAISSRLERNMIQPMAAEAADKLTGPDILKVRTFSSRIEVEKKRKKPIANALAKIIAENLFFPLTGRWWAQSQSYGPANVTHSPHLTPPFLKTLALMVHAAGPSTLSLPQMTSEFLSLLLSMRLTATSSMPITEAVLFSMMMLLEVNEDKKRLASEQGKELVEAQEWARGLLDRVGEGQEEGRVKGLAVGVVVRCQEILQEWRRLILGDVVD